MILDFLFPNRCLECHLIIESTAIICDSCLSQVHFTHFNFYESNILKERCSSLFPTEKAYALMFFEKNNLVQKILHQLKYGQRKIVGKVLANWVIERISFQNNRPDIITTIPLHPSKQRKRGYNQLHQFADVLSDFYKIPVDHQLLKRNTSNKAQAKRNKAQRKTAENQFSVTVSIQNQHVLIIDDVFTTGNTMSRAAWEILKGDNNKISVLVMAID